MRYKGGTPVLPFFLTVELSQLALTGRSPLTNCSLYPLIKEPKGILPLIITALQIPGIFTESGLFFNTEKSREEQRKAEWIVYKEEKSKGGKRGKN